MFIFVLLINEDPTSWRSSPAQVCHFSVVSRNGGNQQVAAGYRNSAPRGHDSKRILLVDLFIRSPRRRARLATFGIDVTALLDRPDKSFNSYFGNLQT